jgi:hypothetical protein
MSIPASSQQNTLSSLKTSRLEVWFRKGKKRKVQLPTATRPNKYKGKISRPGKIATSVLEKITTNCNFGE